MEEHLPRNSELSFLEIGCHPGSWLWYFNELFGYKVSGVEYVEWCAAETQEALEASGVSAEIIHADFFDISGPDCSRQWDIVFSAGFVEHFDDVTDVIQRHGNVCRPGGYVVILIPNHTGIYGSIMKRVAPEKHAVHNLMGLDCLVSGVVQSGLPTIAAEYLGRLGFWSCCVYETIKQGSPKLYPLLRAPLFAAEYAGQALPNSRRTSPYAAVIARKPL